GQPGEATAPSAPLRASASPRESKKFSRGDAEARRVLRPAAGLLLPLNRLLAATEGGFAAGAFPPRLRASASAKSTRSHKTQAPLLLPPAANTVIPAAHLNERRHVSLPSCPGQ